MLPNPFWAGHFIKEAFAVLQTKDLFDLSHTLAAPLLAETVYPWEALGKIKDFILTLGPTLRPEDYDHPAEDIWIAKSAVVAPTASITGPCGAAPWWGRAVWWATPPS